VSYFLPKSSLPLPILLDFLHLLFLRIPSFPGFPDPSSPRSLPIANTLPPSFLGFVDLLGTTYSSATIATGYGSMIAQPLLRKAVEGREHLIEEAEAREILKASLKVLFYRDARSLNKFQVSWWWRDAAV